MKPPLDYVPHGPRQYADEEIEPGRIYPEHIVIACIFAASLIVGVCGVVRALS